MAVQKVTTAEFDAFIAGQGPVVIDFYADWCGPCRMLAPVLESLEGEIPGVRIGKVNVDEEGALAARFGISSIPFVAAFKNGQLTATSLGYVSASALKKRLEL